MVARHLDNVFSAGTQSLMVETNQVFTPINEDWQVIGEILSYDETYAKITFKKVWDTGAVAKTYYAEARYAGKTGIPPASIVNVGSYAIFNRVGRGNVSFSSSQPAFQLGDESAGDKASFVAFFFPEES